MSIPERAEARETPFGMVLFASARNERRSRRPTDVALAIAMTILLILTCVLAQVAGDVDGAFSEFLAYIPEFFRPVWLALAWMAPAWAVVLLAAAFLRGRPSLARDIVAGAVIAVLIAMFVGFMVDDEGWHVISRLIDLGDPPTFPPGLISLAAAAIAVASPHVTRPFRRLGRSLIFGQLIGVVLLRAASGGGAVVAIAIGLLAAAAVHLIVGSPGGRPTIGRVQLALQELGLHITQIADIPGHAEGVVHFSALDANGPLEVKVYGRDAWDAQLLANFWRLAWYRGSQRAMRLSRVQLVEHEAFVTLLAERAGVRAPRLVTAGSAGQGDALVVVRPDGHVLGRDLAALPELTDDGLARLWTDLDALHDAGIAHHRIDLDRVVHREDGSVGFGDLSSASVAESVAERRQDEAQTLALTIAVVGEERALGVARRHLGDDGLLAVVPYLQAAALPARVRDVLDDGDVDLDDVRDRVRKELGAAEQPLIKLRRVSVGSILNLGLLAIAAYALIGAFGDMDLESFVDALRDAQWWWLALALLLAQLPRVPAAISTMGSIEHPLPLGPLTALQFAICYVNLAIPSTAARVAINVRFFQRFGVHPATAMTAGVIDSVSGFVVQIVLFLGLFFFASDIELHLSSDTDDLSGVLTIALIALAVIVVAATLVVAIGPLRRRLIAIVHQSSAALRVLRNPRKLLQLFGGNLVSQLGFAIAFAACLEAFGAHLPFTQLVLINTVVSLFAGLLPVPGGIGVSEAGLTLGLTTAGVPAEIAFAIALAYRFVSFYLPPIWGWFCYQWLLKRRYL